MNGRKNTLFTVLVLGIFLMGMAVPAVSSAASVTTECAYTDADVVCYIYTDTGTPGLISAGVNLSYNTDELSTPAVTKNETDWFFGDGTTNHPYMNPEITETPPQGEVVYIVGKLDSTAPTAGVTGNRVLIGTATFARNTTTDPGADPAGFFGITTSLGRSSGTYVNFVDTAGTDLDGSTGFNTTVAERGDANQDGVIAFADMFAIRSSIGGPYSVFADCNGDGSVAFADMFCVRSKL